MQFVKANIDPIKTGLSDVDAIAVAIQYKNTSSTRSLNREVVGTQTLFTSSGDPALYVVNFTEGYMLISATKYYSPIIADVEYGSFSADLLSSGPGVLIEENVQAIEGCLNDEKSLKSYRKEWHIYEEQPVLSPMTTKVSSAFVQYVDYLYGTLIPAWRAEGYNVYILGNRPSSISDEEYDTMCRIAEEDMQRINDGFEPDLCAVILERIYQYNTNVESMCQTSWGQGYPYNSYISNNNKVGCTAIAAGQIMKYHQKPLRYNWASMPCDTSSPDPELCQFLSDVHDGIGVNSNGGANINEVKRYLRRMNYSASSGDYSGTATVKSLLDGRPVMMFGTDNTENKNHCWVCDGMRSWSMHFEYTLKMPIFINDRLSDMEDYYSCTEMSSDCSLHHNWGYYGDADGYYYDNHLRITVGDSAVRNYSSKRKQILISYDESN